MPLEDDLAYTCPNCGERNALGYDPGGGRRQRLIEDCPVCCRPLAFEIVATGTSEPEIRSLELAD
ncbi:MAG: CPXCG motif-containing cysteine-rich protein [Vulcanimicrobiaceae bacterium]